MVKVDKDLCIGCGLCTSMAPSVFEFDDDGKAKVVLDDAGAAADAAASCPVSAITVE